MEYIGTQWKKRLFSFRPSGCIQQIYSYKGLPTTFRDVELKSKLPRRGFSLRSSFLCWSPRTKGRATTEQLTRCVRELERSCSLSVCLAARAGDEGSAGLSVSHSSPAAPGTEQKAPRLFLAEVKRSTPHVHPQRCPPLTSLHRMHASTRPALHPSQDIHSWPSATVKL